MLVADHPWEDTASGRLPFLRAEKMRLKYTGVVEYKPCENSPGMYMITNGTELVPAGQVMSPEYMRANFTAGDCEALNLLDPDRTDRLCRTGG